MLRRLVAAGLLLAGGLASVGGATPASAAPKAKVSAVALVAPAMNPGQTAWVSVVWTTKHTVSEFAVTAAPPAGVTVGYPADRASTSLYGSSNLVEKTQDFTAIKVSVPYSATGTVTIPLKVSWKYKSAVETMNATLSIPLQPYAGVNLVQLTTNLSIDRTGPAWVEVSFRGAAPSLDAFRVVVTGPEDLEVVYPGDGTSSGLNGSTTLYAGIEDYAAFRLDASDVEPGVYTLDLGESFARPSPVTEHGTVTLVVS